MAHPDESQVALYLDRRLRGEALVALETHLANCPECRAEAAEVRRVLGGRGGAARRWATLLPLGAAAAAVVLLLWSGGGRQGGAPPRTRDPAFTTTLAPMPIAPTGKVEGAHRLAWTSVPGAGRYRVTLFDSEGSARWQLASPDTMVTLPDSVRLDSGVAYYWQVKAETGYGRWVESELVEFLVAGRRGAR